MLLQIITREIQAELQKHHPAITVLNFTATHTQLQIKTKTHTYTITLSIINQTTLQTVIVENTYPIKTTVYPHRIDLNDPNSIQQTIQFITDNLNFTDP